MQQHLYWQGTRVFRHLSTDPAWPLMPRVTQFRHHHLMRNSSLSKTNKGPAQPSGLCPGQAMEQPGNTSSERLGQTCAHCHTHTFSFQGLTRCSKEMQSQHQHQFVCVPKSVQGITYANSGKYLTNRQSGIWVSASQPIGRFTWGNNVCYKTKQECLENKIQKSFWVFQNKQPSSVSELTLWTPKVSNSFGSALPTSLFQHKFRGLSKFKFLCNSQGRKICLSYNRRDFQVQLFLGLSITKISKFLLRLARKSMWVCGCQTRTLWVLQRCLPYSAGVYKPCQTEIIRAPKAHS